MCQIMRHSRLDKFTLYIWYCTLYGLPERGGYALYSSSYILWKSSAIPQCNFDVCIYVIRKEPLFLLIPFRVDPKPVHFFSFFLDALPNETGPSSSGFG